MKTSIPKLDPAVLRRLRDYAAHFASDFPQSKPARWAGVYLQGLLLDGERKSVEPLARRVRLPTDLRSKDPEQALQQFVNQSPWDERKVLRRYRALLAARFADPKGVFIVDDTSFPKRGHYSVGVQHQYCGALGKRANCQVAVTLHYAGRHGHFPLGLQLHLPQSWTGDPQRLEAAGVPDAWRTPLTKGAIALGLLDQARAEHIAGAVVLADAGYGNAGSFREGLARRRLGYLVGVRSDTVVFAQPPRWVRPARRGRRGRDPKRWFLAADSPRPLAVGALARQVPRRRVAWRRGTKGWLAQPFAWVRVWPAQDWHRGLAVPPQPLWLLVEEQPGGELKYALSNLPARTTLVQAVRLWKRRWQVEQGHQQLKEELGLDHFEGRGWRGFHHHACLVLLAYGFLLLERSRQAGAARQPQKKGRGGRG